MAIYKNVASQKIAVYAYDSTAAATPKTGDAANITAEISLGGAASAATNDVNPTELDATDHPGIYIFDLTQAETNAEMVVLSAVSATADIDIDPLQILTIPHTDIIADAVWDEILTGALHSTANSAGKTLRGLSLKAGGSTSAVLIHSGTAQAGTSSTITLDTGAIATNDIYNGALILITGSTGVGQSRKIIDYVGSTKVATVTPDFVVNPTGTSTFEIYASTSDSIIAHEGQAQAGAATTITLDTGASTFDDVYNGSLITLTGGLGSGQTREITDYVGSSKVATVAAWGTNPDSTSVFAIIPSTSNGGVSGGTAPTVGEIADGIWDELQADHATAGTFGEIATEIADIPTTAEFEARTLVAASYFDPAADTVVNVTNVTTTTNLTNLPAITANWLTAAGTAADFTTEIQSGLATAASIAALNDIAATDIVSAGAITTLAGAVVNVDLVDTTTTNTDMVAAAPTAVAIADQVWDEAIAGHAGVGSTGEALAAAGSAGDPWATALPGAYGAGTAGFVLGTNLDAVLSARTLAAAAYFDPATDAVANVTLVATTTTLTNLPAIPANWLTAAGTAADFTTEIQTGLATAASIAALNDVAATDIVSAGAITTLAGAVVNVDLVDTTTTNTDMVAAAPTAAAVADQVWDEAIAGHVGVGSTGEALTAAGAAVDPWATALPGAYGAGTAGLILGTNLDAVLSARTLAAAAYFDPATDAVANVTLVATTTTNTDMRGTDSAALASVCTETRLAELDAANLPADVATLITTVGVAGVGLTDLALSSAGADAVADALLKRDWTAITGEAARSVLNALRAIRNKWGFSGTTLTVTKEDDTTEAWTSVVTTDASADPITSSDPV